MPAPNATPYASRLALAEKMLAVRPLTADGLRVALLTEHGVEVSTTTARTYLSSLRTEGRASSITVPGPAQRSGTVLFHSGETPAAAVLEAIQAIKNREGTFGPRHEGRKSA